MHNNDFLSICSHAYSVSKISFLSSSDSRKHQNLGQEQAKLPDGYLVDICSCLQINFRESNTVFFLGNTNIFDGFKVFQYELINANKFHSLFPSFTEQSYFEFYGLLSFDRALSIFHIFKNPSRGFSLVKN